MERVYEKRPAILLFIHVLTGCDFIVDGTKEPSAIAPSTERATPYAEELGENYKLRILQNKCYRPYGRQATRLIVQSVI